MVFKCEADWAFAMAMKKAISNQEGVGHKQEEAKAGLKNQSLFNQQDPHSTRNTFRLKRHCKKRFSKVFKSSKALQGVCNEVLDGLS